MTDSLSGKEKSPLIRMKRFSTIDLVAEYDNGEIIYHIPPAHGDFHTLCITEIDTIDREEQSDTPKDAKVNCPICIKIWHMARKVPPRLVADIRFLDDEG